MQAVVLIQKAQLSVLPGLIQMELEVMQANLKILTGIIMAGLQTRVQEKLV